MKMVLTKKENGMVLGASRASALMGLERVSGDSRE